MLDSSDNTFKPYHNNGGAQLPDEFTQQRPLNRTLLDDDLDYQPYFDRSEWQDPELMELLGDIGSAVDDDWSESYRH